MGRGAALATLEARISAAGCIKDQDVGELRALVAVPVSRSNCQLLLRLKDAALQGNNAPGWVPYFVETVADHLRRQVQPVPPLAENISWHRRQIAADAGLDEVEKALHAYLADEGISVLCSK